MKISPISNFGNFGHYVDDVDYNNISKEEWLEIGKLNLKGLVTVLRNITISKDQYFEAITSLGVLAYTPYSYWAKKRGKKTLEDFIVTEKKYLSSILNLADKTEKGTVLSRVTGSMDDQGRPTGIFSHGDLHWHSNESSFITFAPVVTLLGMHGMIGSSTGFVQTVDYYESISESFRSELNDMKLVHRYVAGAVCDREKVDLITQMQLKMVMCPTDEVETPLVVTSPGGFKGLRYNVHTAYKIKDMTEEQSAKIFDQINKELFTEKYVFDHWYKTNNDLLLFDNSVTLHRRIGGEVDRLAYRYQYYPTNLIDHIWNPYDDPYYANEYNKIKKNIDKHYANSTKDTNY